jgi:hypothetical protein
MEQQTLFDDQTLTKQQQQQTIRRNQQTNISDQQQTSINKHYRRFARSDLPERSSGCSGSACQSWPQSSSKCRHEHRLNGAASGAGAIRCPPLPNR